MNVSNFLNCSFPSCVPSQGTVSRELKWVLLNISQKLFSRADVANHQLLILLKGHFTIYKKNSSLFRFGNSVATILDAANIVQGTLYQGTFDIGIP